MLLLSHSVVSNSFAISWTVGHQALLSKGFLRQEYGMDCHFLLQGIFPAQGWNLRCSSSAFQADSFPLNHMGSLLFVNPCKKPWLIHHLYGITVYCIPWWKLNYLSQSQIRGELRLEQSILLPVICLTGSFSYIRFLLNKLPSQRGFIKTTQANCCLVTKLCPTLLWSHELQLVRLLCPWDFPGKDIEVGCHFHLQGSSWPRGQTHISCISCTLIWQLSQFNLTKLFQRKFKTTNHCQNHLMGKKKKLN